MGQTYFALNKRIKLHFLILDGILIIAVSYFKGTQLSSYLLFAVTPDWRFNDGDEMAAEVGDYRAWQLKRSLLCGKTTIDLFKSWTNTVLLIPCLSC